MLTQSQGADQSIHTLWQEMTSMQRLARFASSIPNAAAGPQVAFARQLTSVSMLPHNTWPAQLHPEADQSACGTVSPGPAVLWPVTTGFAAAANALDIATPAWQLFSPVLHSQLQAAADLTQIQQMACAGEANLGMHDRHKALAICKPVYTLALSHRGATHD